MSNNTIELIENKKIIAICRGIYGDSLLKLVSALKSGGVNLVEVTFDQGDEDCIEKTCNAIRQLNNEFGREVSIGAGTVLTENQVNGAFESGAKYIISPNTNIEIIRKTKNLGMVSMPGAYTPSEIISADNAGADFVKIFPVRSLGLTYVKDILGPINFVKFIATAGVTPTNLYEYLETGFLGAGISGYLTDRKLISEGRFDILEEHAKDLMSIVNTYNSKI